MTVTTLGQTIAREEVERAVGSWKDPVRGRNLSEKAHIYQAQKAQKCRIA